MGQAGHVRLDATPPHPTHTHTQTLLASFCMPQVIAYKWFQNLGLRLGKAPWQSAPIPETECVYLLPVYELTTWYQNPEVQQPTTSPPPPNKPIHTLKSFILTLVLRPTIYPFISTPNSCPRGLYDKLQGLRIAHTKNMPGYCNPQFFVIKQSTVFTQRLEDPPRQTA
jgi:hypothetical protein